MNDSVFEKEETRWLQTYMGGKMSINTPPSEIQLLDIAQALSNNCRYNGLIDHFYSVAEHSTLLADWVFDLTGDRSIAFGALMHDSPEAFLSDIPRPWKEYFQPGLSELEELIENKIAEAFGVPLISGIVKEADLRICADEREVLMTNGRHLFKEWIDVGEPLGVTIRCLAPKAARELFLLKFEEYRRHVH